MPVRRVEDNSRGARRVHCRSGQDHAWDMKRAIKLTKASNGADRAKYNAYQREYKRRRRATKGIAAVTTEFAVLAACDTSVQAKKEERNVG